MSRPLRISYPGAWYHLMNRSRRGTKLYRSKKDYLLFLEILEETSKMFNLKVAAYCLMPNHYHLLVQTPEGNLARCMRHLNGIFTQKYNIRHKCDGTLFKGRYKSVLVQADSYLLQLVRYIHRNPLKADLTDSLAQYKWSSHNGYISKARKWNWLYKDFVLNILDENKKNQLDSYKSFMGADNSEEITMFYSKKNLPSVLGNEDFRGWVKETFFRVKSDQEIPESKQLAPDTDRINKIVADAYKVDVNVLYVARRGIENEPRNTAVYLNRKVRGEPLMQIGEAFNLKRYSSVSSILERVNRRMNNDKSFRKRIEKIEEKVYKGQK